MLGDQLIREWSGCVMSIKLTVAELGFLVDRRMIMSQAGSDLFIVQIKILNFRFIQNSNGLL